MTETKRDLNEADILGYEIADEALEAAACAGPMGRGALTIAMCTGQAECPF
jgi:hypothetical protein